MKKHQTVYLSLIATALLAAPRIVNAQKLPTVQQISLRAPATIKTDGKATEWNNEFQAYNKATSIFYTMANSADKLLLVINATDPTIIDKILAGGVTLTMFGTDKKSVEQSVAITFPLVSMTNRSGIVYRIKNPEFNIEQGLGDLNNELTNNAKEIQVTGIKEITDTLVSIYNTYDIKVATSVNTKRELTYELSFPLKYIQQHINNTGEFKYNIKLNGIGMRAMKKMNLNGKSVDINSPEAQQALNALATGNVMVVQSTPGGSTVQSATSTQDLYNPTDFSGTYTLAK